MGHDYAAVKERMARRIRAQHPELSQCAAEAWAVRIGERNAAEKRDGRPHGETLRADISQSEAAQELKSEFGIEIGARVTTTTTGNQD